MASNGEHGAHAGEARGDFARGVVIGLIAFLTLVDLFAAQAILPALAREFAVSPAAMGSAVNASTFGMAAAGLGVALFARRIDRRRGIWVSLALLAIPTLLLALTHDLATFAALRVVQGVFMATAFTLTMAYLAENCTPSQAAGALAAYITGNVASNLAGRFLSANLAEIVGVSPTFYFFAALNLAGAALAYFSLTQTRPRPSTGMAQPAMMASWRTHLKNPVLLAAFGIGFTILFAFLGVFTFVNFVLAREPFSLGSAQLGFVYFVFAPAMLTTPLAGEIAQRYGVQRTFWLATAISLLGLAATLTPILWLGLAGLALIAVGTFFAQAVATGFVGRAATGDRTAASGLYLASYYVGGLLGTLILGQAYQAWGWGGCAAGAAAALLASGVLALRLKVPAASAAGTA